MAHGGFSKMKTIFLPLFLACLFAPEARAAELIQLGHVELLRAYSEIKKGDDDLGVDLSGYYSPTVKFNDTLYLIPLYSAQFYRVEQYMPQEEGNVFFDTYLTHNINLALRKEFSPGWFFKVGALGTWNFVRETHEDKWGRGLYDYMDAGASAEIKRQVKKEETVNVYLAAVEYYRRQYPNFATLISETTVTPPERREKDYDGYKLKLRAEAANADGLRGYLETSYLHKLFLDKHLVLEDGTLDTDRQRKDYEIGFDGGFFLPLPWEKFGLTFDSDFLHNFSNMGYYDSLNTLALGDDVYTPHYFAYDSFTVTPAFEFAQPLGEEKLLRLRLGYGYMHRHYPHRKAQMLDGTYTTEEQTDAQHEYFATLTIPLTKKINFVTKYSFVKFRSTQKFETYYRYNYSSYQIKSGISWDF